MSLTSLPFSYSLLPPRVSSSKHSWERSHELKIRDIFWCDLVLGMEALTSFCPLDVETWCVFVFVFFFFASYCSPVSPSWFVFFCVICLVQLMLWRVMNNSTKWFESIPLVHQDPSRFSFLGEKLVLAQISLIFRVTVEIERWFLGNSSLILLRFCVQNLGTNHGVWSCFSLILGSPLFLFVTLGLLVLFFVLCLQVDTSIWWGEQRRPCLSL